VRLPHLDFPLDLLRNRRPTSNSRLNQLPEPSWPCVRRICDANLCGGSSFGDNRVRAFFCCCLQGRMVARGWVSNSTGSSEFSACTGFSFRRVLFSYYVPFWRKHRRLQFLLLHLL
jgi:hypothetical protein